MPILGEAIESPRELYVHKLGEALKMEKKIFEDMLPQLEEAAKDRELKQNLQQHRRETQGHIRNLEQVFRALGEAPDEQPCPAIEGLEKEGQATLGQVEESLNDSVILSGVVETEAHEIAVYDGLITKAQAMGEDDIVALLQENLESEQQTLQKARKATDKLAKRVLQRA
ncbi:MAG TPA: ferritin-like domain-containing protein [Gaiellaceae bacterium]|jgi:ferritin-like metal-binding protein YciE|nr:ferritin-like domain-containing protein [Gaiellaceae bacterium]